MLNAQQEKIFIAMIPSDSTGEDRRAAYSVITGIKDDKNMDQIAKYYAVSDELVLKWYNFFSFEYRSVSTKGRRGRKGCRGRDAALSVVARRSYGGQG